LAGLVACFRENLARFALVPRPHVVRSRHDIAIEHPARGHLDIDQKYQALDPATELRRLADPQKLELRAFLYRHSPFWLRRLKRRIFGTRG
jgi:hypothetical protein